MHSNLIRFNKCSPCSITIQLLCIETFIMFNNSPISAKVMHTVPSEVTQFELVQAYQTVIIG